MCSVQQVGSIEVHVLKLITFPFHYAAAPRMVFTAEAPEEFALFRKLKVGILLEKAIQKSALYSLMNLFCLVLSQFCIESPISL